MEFEKAYPIALEYKNALKSLDSIVSIEEIDKELLQIKKQMSEVAYKLWNVWLSEKKVQLTSYDRQKLIEFVTALELSGDIGFSQNPELRKKFLWATEKLTHVFQCWAVTSLSVKSHIPFVAGLFDYVIIDEASQCDIASILPLLYRAKRAVIIGDPKQLKHIPQISKQLDLELLERYKVPYTWSYSNNSLYDLAASFVDPDRIIQLKDHFRSCSDIIEFSNLFFYDCTLRTATDYAKLQVPNDEKAGVRWLDITGEAKHPKTGSAYNLQEAEAIVIELKKLIDNGYKGSVGVVTPFRAQKELIKKILEKKESKMLSVLMNNNEFIVDTVHGFQGDERDVMLFSTVVSDGLPNSVLSFLINTRNLFNVAITRARAVLIIVGNYKYCENCSIDYLKEFADYYRSLSIGNAPKDVLPQCPAERVYPKVDKPESVSDWEKLFYTVLYDAGIQTIPQYPVDKYKLDLALFAEDGRKLDIEIDGEMYHRNWNGELCYRDQLRNQRLYELGWNVKRFWVYQIRDELEKCVSQIKDWYSVE